jgi:hypothetical protein
MKRRLAIQMIVIIILQDVIATIMWQFMDLLISRLFILNTVGKISVLCTPYKSSQGSIINKIYCTICF